MASLLGLFEEVGAEFVENIDFSVVEDDGTDVFGEDLPDYLK